MFALLRATARKWSDDNASGMAAALAYYALFSLVPLMIVFLALLSAFLGPHAAEMSASQEFSPLFGQDATNLLITLASTARHARNGLIGGLSAVASLIGALGAFFQLQRSMDRIWRAPARNGKRLLARILPGAGIFILIGISGLMLFTFI